ncbi:MAG: polyphosphate kinase 1 [Ginsengibacter sp.]
MTIYNRDLSWLGFNLRVLQEAADPDVPLFERLKFLSIFSSNLDEFFRVRYPGVVALSILNKKTLKAIQGAEENITEKIQAEINEHLRLFGHILHNEILPLLKEENIIFYYNTPISAEHHHEIREIFLSRVLSFIQPIYLDGKSDKVFIPENNHLYLVVTLEENNEGILKQAIVNIPSQKIQRFFVLSSLEGFHYVIFLDDIIRENLVYLFPSLNIISVFSIKLNRDAELHLTDEFSGDLLLKIERQLKKRDFGSPSRFLYEEGMPGNLRMFLAAAFEVSTEDMFAGGRYHNLSDLSKFPSFNTSLTYEKSKPLTSSHVLNSGDIFKVLSQEDILLHIPYQSYNPILSFFNQAAVDVDVTDIYITLYRVAQESHIINALISAAKNGKNVIAFIELKARFDEANNIKWSRIMKKAGVKIIYSMPEIKVHSKIALVIKNGTEGKQSFALVSTGNFNEITAQFYTDHVLMTTNSSIVSELMKLFQFLRGKDISAEKRKIKFKNLLVAQFNMIKDLESLIQNEVNKVSRGEEGLIRIKVNNLEEASFIESLYKASQAGVKIHLIVRSICCIVPGIPGESDNITVKRIVDRYLEHSRILIFGNDENAEVIMGSADLMTRNLKHRIEVFVKIQDPNCKRELLDYFNIQWSDNDKAVVLLPDLRQEKVTNLHENEQNPERKINAQQAIYNYLETKS